LVLPTQQVVALGGGGGGLAGGIPQQRGPVPDAVARAVAASAEHSNTEKVKLPINWDKGSFELTRLGRQLWELSGEFTAELPTELSVHVHCRESQSGSTMDFTQANSLGPPSFKQQYPPGKQSVKLTGANAIDLQRYPLEVFWRYKQSQADILPIVFSLTAQGAQSMVYLALTPSSTRNPQQGKELTCTLLKQEVVYHGQKYTVQEIYGLAELGKESVHDETAVGDPCVICLCEPRNTAVLPCRHLCVCEECGGQLQASGAARRREHCPICRGDITGLQVFSVK